jgi:hypothetical protein
MTKQKKSMFGRLVSIFGSGTGSPEPDSPTPDNEAKPSILEEVSINGFDPDAEPVIKRWSDGAVEVRFEAMPPFFAEEAGTESDFDSFETKLQVALGVVVQRQDREVFVISEPKSDTVSKAKAWLESYHDRGA